MNSKKKKIDAEKPLDDAPDSRFISPKVSGFVSDGMVDGNLVLTEQGEAQPQIPGPEVVKALKGPKRFRFRGDDYELGKLTEAQKEYLRQFPGQVPYLGE
jgi:hypothetical protein